MKLLALLITIVALSLFAPTSRAVVRNEVKINSDTDGGDSSVKVTINNQVNTDSSSTSKSETNVSVHQSGEGEAQVKINGQEYKLEGPGDLNVNESTGPTTTELTPTPTVTVTPEDNSDEVEEQITDSTSPIVQLERIKSRFDQWRRLMQTWVSQLLDIF